jgi:pilus assembly protein CpaB
MRNLRPLSMIAVSLALATAAVFFAWRYVGDKSQIDSVPVAVASRDIDLGARLTPDMIQLVQWPRSSAPDGAFSASDQLLNDPQTKAARIARVSIQRGEPLLESRFAPVGSKAGLSAVIDSGKRAITVRVNDVVGVAGFALPGNFVDVLVNTTPAGTPGGQTEQSISKIVLDHILVLAAAQEVSRDESKPKVVSAVTLEVTPEQAERLDLARSVGTLSLVLRNQIDTATVASSGATKRQLLEGSALAAPGPSSPTVPVTPPARRGLPPAGRSGDRIEVIKGTERVVHES